MSITSRLATTLSWLETLDFTAVDFETANGQRGSVCGAGIVQVRGGRIARVEQTLVRPPRGLDYFSPRNIAMHGITFKAVQNAPTWPEVWDTLAEVADGDVIVAHNAAFDLSVITGANAACGIDAPRPTELCTVKLSRLLLPELPNHELRTIATHFDLPVYDHEPGYRAVACAGIAVFMAHRAGVGSARDLAALGRVPSMQTPARRRGV